MSDPRWIPVSERLPDEEQEVLAYFGPAECGDPNIAIAWVVDGNQWGELGGEIRSPLFWMPLPEPPEVKW